ncbi:MAG: cytochrome c biogenesis protein ResB, partial [Bacilli bacterium]
MKEVKCACGHCNPIGISFCEHCGLPQDNENTLLDMRYEGTARRSMKRTKTVVDHVWTFFSSVKVGIVIIILTLIASAIGTIFPQQYYIPSNADPSAYYRDLYGVAGQLYYELGFHNLYSTWWFMLLLASLGISLVVCSLDRVVPLYRALNKQSVVRHPSFMKRQRITASSTETMSNETEDEWVLRLQKRKYNVRRTDEGFLAEKARFSRWGPYVNHIGLIIFLFGLMLRAVPGMYADEYFWIREGEVKEVPGTDGRYYVRNESFTWETYDKEKESDVFENAIDRVGNNSIPKNYETKVTWFERTNRDIPGAPLELKELKKDYIIVNHPGTYDGFGLYQSDFRADELYTMSFYVEEKSTGEKLGSFTIDLYNPLKRYDVAEGTYVELREYFPDYYFSEEGALKTKLKIPNNPGFVMRIVTPETPKGEVAFIAIKENIEPEGNNAYKIAFKGITTRDASGLTVKLDRTIPILVVGATIFMIGVI